MPQVAALLYCAAVPFDAFTVIAGRTLPSLVGAVFLVTWMASLTRRTAPLRFPRVLVVSAVALLAWAITTLLWAPPEVRLIGVASMAYSIVLMALLVDTMKERLRSALLAYIAGACVLATWLVVSPTQRYSGRYSVGGADENETAFQFAIAIGAVVWLYLNAQVRSSLLLGSGLLLGFGVILTGSRTGFVAMAAIVCAGLAHGALSRRGASLRMVLLVAMGLIAVAVAAALNVIPLRVLELLEGETSLRDSSRAQIAELYLKTVDHWWFFGVGYGSDAVYLEATEGVVLNAHGLFFKGWVEQGAVGLLLIVALLLSALVTARVNDGAVGYLILAVPVLIFGITLAGLGFAGFWFVLALSALTSGGGPPGRGGGAAAPVDGRPDDVTRSLPPTPRTGAAESDGSGGTIRGRRGVS
ncbi:O-antigen ligase family protein [Brachybacterium vulturis]|uniref:O-antigen ligase family protein n=1 Tax=Brachybacterium vulturis TaxID=2017484 RepID=UPI00373527DC